MHAAFLLLFLCFALAASERFVDCMYNRTSNENTPGFNITVFATLDNALKYCDSEFIVVRFYDEDYYFRREADSEILDDTWEEPQEIHIFCDLPPVDRQIRALFALAAVFVPTQFLCLYIYYRIKKS